VFFMRIMNNSVTRAMARHTLTPAHVVEAGRGWITPGNHPCRILGHRKAPA
jgi:hypothetical protein